MNKHTQKHKLKQKKHSIFPWILIIVVFSLLYSYYFMQSKHLKVITLVGNIEDYLTPTPIDINIVLSGKYASIPKSDFPEVYAAAVTNQYVNQQEAIAKAKGEEYEPDEETLNQVASQALSEAYQDSAAAGAISASEAIAIVKGKNEEGSQFNQELGKALEIVDEKLATDSESDEDYSSPLNANFVDMSISCKTQQGAEVYGGEKTLGDLAPDKAGENGYYEVMICTSTGWQVWPDCIENPTGETRNCRVSILPSYYQNPGHANCFEDNHLIGHSSIVGSGGDSPRQCVNGNMVPVASSVEIPPPKSDQASEFEPPVMIIPDPVTQTTPQNPPQTSYPPQESSSTSDNNRDRGRSRVNRPATPPVNNSIVVGSVLSTRESCASANGRWSELLGECILKSYPSSSPSTPKPLASYVPEPSIDQDKLRACQRLNGNYLPEINSCLSSVVSRSNTKIIKDFPLQISSDIDLDDLNLKGTLGEIAAQVAEITGQCQLAGNGSGQALYDCMCDSIECSPGSAGEKIATYLKANSTDQLGLQCVEYATIIISAVGDGSSPICKADQAKNINKSCLPKNESNGWYYCENPTELYADDVGIFAGSDAIGDPGHIGLCADGDGSSTCLFADVNYRVDNQALVHPVAASEMTAVFRKLPDGHPATIGCWASQNIYIN